MALNVPVLNRFEIKFVRKAVRDLITAAAPLATVHRDWRLELNDGIGRYTNDLKGKGDHSGLAHCWMIGVSSEVPITTDTGHDRYVGGYTSEYILNLAVWGFFEWAGWQTVFGNDPQAVAPDSAAPDAVEDSNAIGFSEKEHRAIKGYVRANPNLDLTFVGGNVSAFPFRIDDANIHNFSNKKRVLVLQGSLPVRVKESFA